MRSWLAAVALSLLAGAVGSTAAHAQVGAVRGKVVDSTGAPLPGALIAVDRTAIRAQATSSGTYTLVGVPAGARTRLSEILSHSG